MVPTGIVVMVDMNVRLNVITTHESLLLRWYRAEKYNGDVCFVADVTVVFVVVDIATASIPTIDFKLLQSPSGFRFEALVKPISSFNDNDFGFVLGFATQQIEIFVNDFVVDFDVAVCHHRTELFWR